jgi:hypothetical protein
VGFLRRVSTLRLIGLCSAVLVVAIGVTGLALATTGGGPKPDPKPLATAVRDAFTAPPVQGVSGRIEFTNHLIAAGSIQGTDPLLGGASGRFWASPDGRLRIELQADASSHGSTGDVQLLLDHSKLTVYDSGANAAYEVSLSPHPSGSGNEPKGGAEKAPSLSQVQGQIDQLMRSATVSGAIPSDVAGQPAYTVRVSPKSAGGMVGGAELAWDAIHGTPLRAAIYARGESSPVLELKATDVSFGAVPASVFSVGPPRVVSVTKLDAGGSANGSAKEAAPVTGLATVQHQAGFRLAAPDSLGGQARSDVRLVSQGKDAGALVSYGRGLGGIAVLELPAGHDSGAGSGSLGGGGGGEGQGRLQLPTVSINGAKGQELDTALGSVLRFDQGGVQYVVAGSVAPATVRAAASGL